MRQVIRTPYGLLVGQSQEVGRLWRSRDEEPEDCDVKFRALPGEIIDGRVCSDEEVDIEDRDEVRHMWSVAQRLCTPRQQAVLRLRFDAGMTLDEIAQSMNVSRERIRQIEKYALIRLRAGLESASPGEETFGRA